jgi:hypothetical protein
LNRPDRFITPPANYGQIVTVSYGYTRTHLVEERWDASDRTTRYRVARWSERLNRWAEYVGAENSPPPPARWSRSLSIEEVERRLARH